MAITPSFTATTFSSSSFPTLFIKLDRDNYFLWRTTILLALEAFDMDRYVNGDITAPPQYIQVTSTNNKSPKTSIDNCESRIHNIEKDRSIGLSLDQVAHHR
ncbi:hypothetical protein L6164_016630 [Bauhinia variegata]|uniref:Uncharacterized protein n=1 Tax=Bauhinia variegata TaxID=167791 RepID=A0ACB9NPI4_BAUVA|nr:hypothetical protein L6164_016630 [Bauhinia variegata]